MHLVVIVTLLIAAAWIVGEHLHLLHGLRARSSTAPLPSRWPSLTVVRPARGLDVGAEENARALLASQYPGELEILFVFDDENDLGLPPVRAAIADHERAHSAAHAKILFSGPPPRRRTGKLHAMGVGLSAARGELVAFSDSDTCLDHDLLPPMVARLLATPGAGDIFAPALAASPPKTPGDVGYAIMLNSWYGAVAAAAAGPRHELPFIMGQLMIWKRDAIAAIGGLECADGQLVDDMYLGRRVAEVGMHNLMSERPLRIVGDGLSAGDFLHLFRRWLVFGVNGLPGRFVRTSWVRGGVAWIAIAGLVLALVHHWPATALLAAATLALLCTSDVLLHRAVGGPSIPLRWWWLGLSVPLLGPWMMLSVLFNHHLGWRGRDYTLDRTAHLSPNIPDNERSAQ